MHVDDGQDTASVEESLATLAVELRYLAATVPTRAGELNGIAAYLESLAADEAETRRTRH